MVDSSARIVHYNQAKVNVVSTIEIEKLMLLSSGPAKVMFQELNSDVI